MKQLTPLSKSSHFNALTGFPRSGKSQGKMKKVQGQGKVREL